LKGFLNIALLLQAGSLPTEKFKDKKFAVVNYAKTSFGLTAKDWRFPTGAFKNCPDL